MMPNEFNNLIRLIDSICVAWDNPKYYPELENGVLVRTHCNAFVDEVARGVGCNDFHDMVTKTPLMADDIVRVMGMSDNWQEIRVSGLDAGLMALSLRSVQAWANQGFLTIAAATGNSIGAAHGHIAVVRPGNLKSSGKWGDVPTLANVGRENFIGRAKTGPMKGEPVGVNEAFRQMPLFFSWKGA